MEAVATVVGALIGAALGSIGAVVVRGRLEQRQEAERLKDVLLQRHLVLLQEAVEGFWWRLDNMARRGGRAVMDHTDPKYWEITSLYALGRALGEERLLAIEGVYPQIANAWPDLGSILQANRIDHRVKDVFGDQLFHYDILMLAEGVMVRTDQAAAVRLMTYPEFHRAYQDDASGLRASVAAALDALESMDLKQNRALRDSLSPIALRLSAVTKVPTGVRAEDEEESGSA